MKTAVLAGSLAALLLPAAAMAGGYVAPAPAPEIIPVAPAPVGTDWTGLYGGVQLEYGDLTVDDNAGNPFAEGDGALYGVFGGYRYDFGTIVVGAELDLTAADITIEDLTGTPIGSLDSVIRLGGEVGFDAGRALIYGTAGYARATATLTGVERSDDGYFFGAGVDYLVTDQISVGVEVLQHQFDDFDGTTLDVEATTFGINAAFRF